MRLHQVVAELSYQAQLDDSLWPILEVWKIQKVTANKKKESNIGRQGQKSNDTAATQFTPTTSLSRDITVLY